MIGRNKFVQYISTETNTVEMMRFRDSLQKGMNGRQIKMSIVCLALQKILHNRMFNREVDDELTEERGQQIWSSLLFAIGVIAVYERYS